MRRPAGWSPACRGVSGFVFCSSGSTYAYQGQTAAARRRSPGRPSRRLQPFEDRRRSRRAIRRDRTRSAAHDHPHLLDLRTTRGSARRPSGSDPRRRRRSSFTPIAPNNYNPIYEDDYVRLGIRAMQVAATPAGHRQLGGQRDRERRGLLRLSRGAGRKGVRIRYDERAPWPIWPDVTLMHQVLGGHEDPLARRHATNGRGSEARLGPDR